MKALVIGSGGREFTIGWKMAKSSAIDKLFFLPGNGGTQKLGKNVYIDNSDFASVSSFIKENRINLVVVGPEAPLVAGITDYLQKNNNDVSIIGPSQKGAMLEGSKDFAKKFMSKYNIPTAKYNSFTKNQLNEAILFLNSLKPPFVLKADGLAGGKGVIIESDIEIAKKQLKEMFAGKFGQASKKILIEEFLKGVELSVFALTDGKNFVLLPPSKDYKRIGDNDTGLNTGGMGAVSPVPFADEVFMNKVRQNIVKPTINGICSEKINYKGFLYFGLMNVKGNPYVVEYNVRMGDPEAQVVLPRIENDFTELLLAIDNQNLDNVKLNIDNDTTLGVVLASKGYPQKYQKNKEIHIKNINDKCMIFYAGTKSVKNKLYSNGGRVLTLTCKGKNISDTRKKVYNHINNISFENKYFRTDIGLDLL